MMGGVFLEDMLTFLFGGYFLFFSLSFFSFFLSFFFILFPSSPQPAPHRIQRNVLTNFAFERHCQSTNDADVSMLHCGGRRQGVY